MVKLRVEERSARSSVGNFKSFLVKRNFARSEISRNSIWEIIEKRRKDTDKLYIHVKRRWDKYLLRWVQIFALVSLGIMIYQETDAYNAKSTGTAVDDDMFPVQKITFPAIALCSFNIIDLNRTKQAAGDLWNRTTVKKLPNVTLERIEEVLIYMGHFFSFSHWEKNPGDFKLFNKILIAAHGRGYNVPKTMERLSLPCRKVLQYCSWSGEIRSCEELFIPRWTQNGLCCTFNYVRWTDDISTNGETDFSAHIERTKYSGYEYGLRIYIEPTHETEYYTTLAAHGYKILVFNPTDYPDAPSGGLKEVFIGTGTDHYLKIKATFFYSAPEVAQQDLAKRQCLFNWEFPEEFGGFYSYSQCLMLCRAKAIVKTCNCIPFFYPYPKEYDTALDCTVEDLPCLYKHRNQWWSIKPLYDDEVNAWDEDDDNFNLDCPNCLPNCETVDYAVFHTASGIQDRDVQRIDFLSNYNRANLTNETTLITISFENPTILRLRQDVLYYWYDLMSTYGGLCSMFLGLSILSPLELVWDFISERWEKRKKLRKIMEKSKIPEIQTIYWQELIQPAVKQVQWSGWD